MMVRPPNVALPEQRRLIAKLRRDLERFRRIPPHLRDAEHADEGEAACRALLAELGVSPEEGKDGGI